ncbi:MAG: type II toxin-antitoxin system VapC family toxin [Bryobacteraceae bacterium]
MIILDTNVLSEALKPVPSAVVLRWLAAQAASVVFTTTITMAEVLYGVEALPPGKRRTRLLAAVEKMFAEEFEGRILPFDEDATRAFAGIVASRDRAGHPISQFDAMIAAIARSHRAAVATRNTADFDHCGIQVIDPWTE